VIDPGQLDGIYNNLVAWPSHINLKGDLAVEAAALHLNIMLGGFDSGDSYGHLVVSGMGNALDGQDLVSIRAIVNTYLATGQLPEGLKPKDLLHIVKNINLAYHGCKESDWAKTHLVVVANIPYDVSRVARPKRRGPSRSAPFVLRGHHHEGGISVTYYLRWNAVPIVLFPTSGLG
jgi:hypothetical protein